MTNTTGDLGFNDPEVNRTGDYGNLGRVGQRHPKRKRKRRNSDVSNKGESMGSQVRFTSPSRDSIAIQLDLIDAMRRGGYNSWTVSSIEGADGGPFSFTVKTNMSDQYLNADALANRVVANVSVKDEDLTTESVSNDEVSIASIVERVSAGECSLDEAARGYLNKSLIPNFEARLEWESIGRDMKDSLDQKVIDRVNAFSQKLAAKLRADLSA